MIIRELLTRWGITVDDAKLDAFEQKLGATVVTAAAVGAAATIAGAGLLKLALDSTTAATGAAGVAKNLGITTQALQELRYAASLFGLEAQDLDDSLKDLQDKASAAEQGDEGLQKTFKDLGINAKEFIKIPADKKLEMLADGFRKIQNPARATQIRMELMSDAGFKLGGLLDTGSAGIQKMRQEARDLGLTLQDDAIKGAQDFGGEMIRLRALGAGLALQLGARLIPVFSGIVKEMRAWINENRGLINTNLDGFARGASTALRGLWWFLRAVAGTAGWLVSELGGLNRVLFYTKFLLATFVTYRAGVALQGLIATIQAARAAYLSMGAAAAWAQIKAFALPIALAALVVIVGLLIDDFSAFFSGQKSGIGELVKQYPELGGALWALHDAWIEAGKVAEEFFDEWLEAWPEFKALVWDAIFSVIDGFNNLEAQIPAAFERAKLEALAQVDELVRGIAGKLAGVVGRVELVADSLGLDAPALRAARLGLEGVSVMGSAPRLGDAAAPRVAGAAAQLGQRPPVSFGDTNLQVTQLPGESGEGFALRVADEVDRKRASQLRQARAATEGGIAY